MRCLQVFSLVAVLAVAGCVSGPFESLFSTGTTQKAAPDLLVTTEKNVIPTPPVPAGQEFTYSFQVFNQDKTNPELKGVNVNLYDWGICNAGNTAKTDTFNLAPGGIEPIEFVLTAPSNAVLAGLGNECILKYKITYGFTAESQASVQVISNEKLKSIQKSSGKSPEFMPSQNIGIGPVKITFGFDSSMPVKSGNTIPIYLVISDEGSGIIKLADGKIGARELLFKVPKDFVVLATCGKFETSNDEEIGGVTYSTYKNTEPIPMIKDKSPPIRCSFTAPDKIGSETITDERTLALYARLNYIYDINEEQSVGVKPIVSG